MLILFALAKPQDGHRISCSSRSVRPPERLGRMSVRSFHGKEFKKAMEFVAAVDEVASESQLSERGATNVVKQVDDQLIQLRWLALSFRDALKSHDGAVMQQWIGQVKHCEFGPLI
jgi:uncharacterized protein (DUF2252 family)